MMLREQSLIAKLEEHRFLRCSLAGLRDKMPTEYERIRRQYGSVEAYAELEVMVNKNILFDTHFAIWMKWGEYAFVVERKPLYPWEEVEVISEKHGISIAEFQEIAKSTSAFQERAAILSEHMGEPPAPEGTGGVWHAIRAANGGDGYTA